jgi:hypothetical protein
VVESLTPLGDLWHYDLGKGEWKQLKPEGTPPPARWHALMAFNAQRRKVYLFGGAGLGEKGFDRQLYELDLKKQEWKTLRVAGERPPSLQGGTLSFDSEHQVLVLVGGLRHERPGPATISDIWVFDFERGEWERIQGTSSFQRRDHAGGYDPATRRHYVVGGRISKEVGNFYEPGQPVESFLVFKLKKN